MKRLKEAILSAAFLSFVIPMSCNVSGQKNYYLKDNEVFQQVLSRNFQDGGFTIVAPITTMHGIFDSNESLDQFKSVVAKELEIPGCNIESLLEQLIERNKMAVQLTIESAPESGFIIDYDSTFMDYFLQSEDGGWKQLYKDHPFAHGITEVSLPVCDSGCGVVLIYRGIQEHWKNGSGWLITFKVENRYLTPVDSIELWVS